MIEYLCLTLLAQNEETTAAFKTRLIAFWSHLLRTAPETYQKVYAEAAEFELTENRVSRRYFLEKEAAALLLTFLAQNQLEFLPLDVDDAYSKYEATSPEWFQIAH